MRRTLIAIIAAPFAFKAFSELLDFTLIDRGDIRAYRMRKRQVKLMRAFRRGMNELLEYQRTQPGIITAEEAEFIISRLRPQ